jgi:hypothetical protein
MLCGKCQKPFQPGEETAKNEVGWPLRVSGGSIFGSLVHARCAAAAGRSNASPPPHAPAGGDPLEERVEFHRLLGGALLGRALTNHETFGTVADASGKDLGDLTADAMGLPEASAEELARYRETMRTIEGNR